MTDTSQDIVLMQRVCNGDRDAFEELVRVTSSGLLTFLCRTNGNYHQCEELFQKTFLTVWNKRQTYQYPKPVKPWLYQIALNICRACWRKANLPMENIAEAEDFIPSPEKEPSDRLMNQELQSIASQAILDLPDQQKSVVALRIWNEMSYREIAEVMKLKEATVRSHMHHAMQTLRQQLDSKMFAE